MQGKYVRLAPPQPNPAFGFAEAPQQYAQFDPKTVFLIDGAAPMLMGRASTHRSSGRPNDPDNAYLLVPKGKTALGAKHASLCLRNGTLYISMLERDGLVSLSESAPPRQVAPHSEYFALRSGSRVRLGVAGAADPGVTLLVDVVFQISDTDIWGSSSSSSSNSKPMRKPSRFIRELPREDSFDDLAMDVG